MKTILSKCILLGSLVLLFSIRIHAQQPETFTPKDNSPEAIFTYLENALQLIEQKGEQAFEELTDPNGPWVKGDWYLFINSFDGYNVAHVNKNLIGKQFFALRDIKGNAFFAELQKAAMSDQGRGWVEFWWPKPNEKTFSRKIGFVMRIPGKKLWIGTGVYDMTDREIDQLKKTTPQN